MAVDFLSILSDQRAELERLDQTKLVTRKEEQLINLDSPLAQVVIGVRRSGKSTLCEKRLLESGVPFGYNITLTTLASAGEQLEAAERFKKQQ